MIRLLWQLAVRAWHHLTYRKRREALFDLAIQRVLRDAAERDRRTRAALFSIVPLGKSQREENKWGPS